MCRVGPDHLCLEDPKIPIDVREWLKKYQYHLRVRERIEEMREQVTGQKGNKTLKCFFVRSCLSLLCRLIHMTLSLFLQTGTYLKAKPALTMPAPLDQDQTAFAILGRHLLLSVCCKTLLLLL